MKEDNEEYNPLDHWPSLFIAGFVLVGGGHEFSNALMGWAGVGLIMTGMFNIMTKDLFS